MGNFRLIGLILLLLLSSSLFSQYSVRTAFKNVNFQSPVDIQAANDGTDRLFVVEQQGRIMVMENYPTVPSATVFLDIEDQVDFVGEKGLLGLAFHPEFRNNGFFYVNYVADTSPDSTFISRFSVSELDSNIADLESELVLLKYRQPFSNHNGGQLAFGPDGFLYIASGDGGGSGDPRRNGQNINTLLGAILRIDVDRQDGSANYAVPPSNPFVDDSTAKREIFAYGFRNPWRFSFDHEGDGKLWCGDVGQANWEEISIVEAGGNYGWSHYEGFHCYDGSCDSTGLNLKLPIFEYDHNTGKSITGGYVYRGQRLPDLVGKYIYGDFIFKHIWSLDYNEVDPATSTRLGTTEYFISTFGTDEQNELYFAGYYTGNIYGIYPGGGTEPNMECSIILPADSGDGNFNYKVLFYNRSPVDQQHDVWVDFTQPQGIKEIYFREDAVFQAGDSVINNYEANLPPFVPPGSYEITVHIGKHPHVSEYSSSGIYTKLPQEQLVGENNMVGNLVPEETALGANYPNPFNPSTKIRYQISETSEVTLNIYDVSGRLVRQLTNEVVNQGFYEATWDGTDNTGQLVGSGVYFYTLSHSPLGSEAAGGLQTRKMLLVR